MKNTALITGASSGIGYNLTILLLQKNWNVISLDWIQFPLIDPIIKNAINNGYLKLYFSDLADFKKLKQTLAEIKVNEPYLDVIFNNAESKSGSLHFSPQKREIDFEINTVVPYIISRQLTPLLEKGKFKTIVNKSSKAALKVKKFNPHQLENPSYSSKLYGSYILSKLALIIWTNGIASQLLQRSHIKIRSVDPSFSKRPMSIHNLMPWFIKLVTPFVFPIKAHNAYHLYESAFGKFQHESGVFIVNGKDTPINFLIEADVLIRELDLIYRQEFNDIRFIY